MKKTLAFAAVTASLILTSFPVCAVPLGRSNEEMNYLFKDPVLSRVTAGAYVGEVNREIIFKDSSIETEMNSARVTGYLGLSLLGWLNVYGIAGQNSAEIPDMDEPDGEAIYGGGISINLLNHFLREPLPMEDAFRLNLGVQILNTEAQFGDELLEWSEFSGALTISVINHTTGNKNYTPETIAIYLGPAISYIRSDEFEGKNNGGVVGGMEIFFTDSFAVDIRVEYFEQASASAGINLHF
jgi:hypothetical protein